MRKNTSIIDKQMQETQKRLESKKAEQTQAQTPATEQAPAQDAETVIKQQIAKEKTPTAVEKPSILDNPLTNEPVKRKGKEYTQPQYSGEIPDRAPVPTFNRPVISLPGSATDTNPETMPEQPGDNKETKTQTQSSGSGASEPSEKPQVTHNNSHNDGGSGETPKESKKKAEQAVEAAIFAWDFLWGQVGRMIELSPDKLEKKSLKGLIDLRILDKQLDDGRTVGQVIAEYNSKVEEETAPDEEFNEDLRPFLVRIFKEKGWGLSDDQYVLFKIAVKMIERVIRLISMNAMVTGMLKKESQDYIQAHGAPRGKQKAVIPEAETATMSPEPVTEKDLGKNTQKHEPETVDYELMPEGTLDTEDANKIIAKNQTFAEGE